MKKKSPQNYTMDVERLAKEAGMTVDEWLGPDPNPPKGNPNFDPNKLKYGPKINKK